MIVTGLCFVTVTAIVKHSAQDLPAAQAAFMRYVLGLVFFLPVAKGLMATRLERATLVRFSLRGVIHSLGVILWFFSMTRIPIAEVTAMNYLVPIYVTVGAALFLGEKLAARRIAAVGAGLLGALIILRPGFREVDLGHIAMLGTAAGFAGSYLLAKKLSGEVPASMVVAMLSIFVTLGLAPFAFAVWVPPSLEDWGWMFLVAVFATGGHYAMTYAFAAAPVTVTQPVTFLQLVWAVLLGWLAFNETPDVWVIVGGGVIISAVSFITWRESVLRRAQARAAIEAGQV